MNRRFLSVLLFAFLVASAASFLLYRLLVGRAAAKAPPATTQVVVATRDLELGALVKDADVGLADLVSPIPAGATRKKEDLIGRGVVATIYRNEVITDSHLAPRGAGAGLSAMIPAGMRAVAVRVNEVVGVAGFVVPGMRVDVLISGNPESAVSGNMGSITKTLLQNIEVLSAGQNFHKDAEGKPVSVQVVNLLVTPEQAEMLSLASTQATIQLVLRNPLDTGLAEPPGSALARLFGVPLVRPGPPQCPSFVPRELPAPHAASPQPKLLVVEMINGNKRIETKFDAAEEERP